MAMCSSSLRPHLLSVQKTGCMRRQPWQSKLHRVSRRRLQSNSSTFKVSEEVREAIESKRPVVALESTIYTHGLPSPDNLSLSSRLEDIVRQEGAVPATVGVLEGVARVGLTEEELATLVEKPGPRKISRRDFGLALKDNTAHGGTTIAGTMILAHLAGIKVFATGGLGGVHRGGQDSLDVSADLTELGRTPVAVICSGCKGFLDIGRTLEYLETQGVGVATFADGRTGKIDFPAFWSRESGLGSPATLLDELEAAKVIYAQTHLPINSGLLFANPVPEESSIPRSQLDDIIRRAVDAADKVGARGSANTPFILRTIKDLSGGRSVEANEALVEANVRRGSKVSAELSMLEQQSKGGFIAQPSRRPSMNETRLKPEANRSIEASDFTDILVAGSVAIDTACTYRPRNATQHKDDGSPLPHTSNPAIISQTLGGVGANVARAARLAGAKTKLCSVVANDFAGKIALESLKAFSIDCQGIHTVPSSVKAKTSQYVAVNDAYSQLEVGMADMNIIEQPHGTFEDLWVPHVRQLSEAKLPGRTTPWMIIDANWDTKTLHKFLSAAREGKVATAFEPVSVAKSTRLFESPNLLPERLPCIANLASPNELELVAMHDAARNMGATDRADWWQAIDALGIPGSGARAELVTATSQALVDKGVPQRSIQMLPFVPNMITKLGSRGVLLTRILPENDEALNERYNSHIIARSKTGAGGVGGLYVRLFPPEEVLSEEEIVSVNGAGDTFLGALIAQMAGSRHARLEDAISFAQNASLKTLQSAQSVSPKIVASRVSARV